MSRRKHPGIASTVGGPMAAKGWDNTAEWQAAHILPERAFHYGGSEKNRKNLDGKLASVLFVTEEELTPVIKVGNGRYPIPRDVFVKTLMGLRKKLQEETLNLNTKIALGGFTNYAHRCCRHPNKSGQLVVGRNQWQFLKKVSNEL